MTTGCVTTCTATYFIVCIKLIIFYKQKQSDILDQLIVLEKKSKPDLRRNREKQKLNKNTK